MPDDFHDSSQNEVHPSRKSLFVWLAAFGFATSVFLLTNSPLLAASYPYLRAGWPSFSTGCWLRRVDPWPARGRATFYFYLATSGFLAAAAGVATLLMMVFVEQWLQRPPDVSQIILTMLAITGGLATSTLFGWLGIISALRHRIRVLIVPSLRADCHGDFSQLTTMPGRSVLNLAFFVMLIAIAVPLLAVWGIAMVILLAPDPQRREPSLWIALPLVTLPPFLIPLICIWVLSHLSTRIIARSSLECWGAVPPIEETDPWA